MKNNSTFKITLKNKIFFFKSLVFCFFLILISCSKDDYNIKQDTQNKISRKIITFEEFRSKIKLEQLSQKIQKKLNNSEINITSNGQAKGLDDFTIYTNEIKQIEQNNVITYSMLIEKTSIDAKKLYNLLIEDKNGVVNESIIEYDLKGNLTKINRLSTSNLEIIKALNIQTPENPAGAGRWGIVFIAHMCSENIHNWWEDGCQVGGGWLEYANYWIDESADMGEDIPGNGGGYYFDSNGNYIGGASGGGAFGPSAQAQHYVNLIKQHTTLTLTQEHLLLHNDDLASILAWYINDIGFVNWTLNLISEPNMQLMTPTGLSALLYFDIYSFYVNLTPSQQLFLNNNPIIKKQIYQYIFENGNDIDDSKVFANEIMNFEMEEDWKTDIKQAISTGITSSAELTHKMYSKLSVIATNHPASIGFINTFIDGIRAAVDPLIDKNPSTCNWTDLFNIWMFELGSNPIIINGSSVTVLSLQNQEGVIQARTQAINQIANNNLSALNNPWTYGQGAFYQGMSNGNIATSFLGSYNTNVSIIALANGQHQLTFHVSNSSTWDSATRLRIDNDHDGVHDGIFPNHIRNATNTLHLGGNFTQDWWWTEIVN